VDLVIWLWGILFFCAGALFWHMIGARILRRALGSEEYRARVVGGLGDETLVKLEKAIVEEIVRRQGVLDDRNIKAAP
jgi:hypothetical protein